MKLQDKVAVVTGGTRGIGRAMVEALAREGAQVLFTYAHNDLLAGQIESELREQGLKAKGFKIDVRDFEKINQWKEEILIEFGGVDILINNAGIAKDKALMMMSREDWDEVIDTNLNGLFNFTRAFIVHFLKKKEGNIINISSVSGLIGLPRQVNYSASKGGMISFSKALAKEVAPYNIRVNVICPGFIDTDMTRKLREEYVRQMMPLIPLGRFGTVEEVARTALFLADETVSHYITGQVIRVDGGLTM
ncbi:MAG: 3-oxoacyl-[acyl-carrier-protein] reductase [Candidatus Omnitrophica bacterium]|nr:3-oxoacyl-[acyl-carrier-protein] reductase [Candidatus Omnitrophota bacterium]MBU4479511.1 3-oxoacyl-[acyl-carrier-protein] reductase [Candidatus Omnitrophota bacterium]MCG2702980.1 3-oxoacyl-[acyl-carrier-protein] reductase [Candidatus Omnitrophota bacterium]